MNKPTIHCPNYFSKRTLIRHPKQKIIHIITRGTKKYELKINVFGKGTTIKRPTVVLVEGCLDTHRVSYKENLVSDDSYRSRRQNKQASSANNTDSFDDSDKGAAGPTQCNSLQRTNRPDEAQMRKRLNM